MTFPDHTPRRGPRIPAAAGLAVVLIGAGTAIGFVGAARGLLVCVTGGGRRRRRRPS